MVGIPADKYIIVDTYQKGEQGGRMTCKFKIPFARTDTYKNSFFCKDFYGMEQA